MKKIMIRSCVVLCTLYASIGVALNPVFAAEDHGHGKSGIVSEALLKDVSQSWDGAELKAYPTGQPAITLLKITVPPKTKLPRHFHSVVNVGYMLEGELTVTADTGQTQTIKAGEPLIEMVGTIHYGENKGDTPAVILVFYAGEAKTPITTTVE